MKIYERVCQGAEAGLVAGVGVALFFLVTDGLQLAPLRTPALLAGASAGSPWFDDTGIVAQAASVTTLGFRVVVYTVLHLCVFALVGVVGSFLIPTAKLFHSLAVGALYGASACTAVFYGSRLLVTDHPVVMEGVGVPAVVTANALAGLILAAGLYLVRVPSASEGVDSAPQPS